MFGFLEYFFNFSIVVLLTKLNPVVVCWKPWPFSWIFVVKTALIWLVLVGFFCVFSQSESICNLHSCYKFALVLQKSCTPFSANQNWVIFSCTLLVFQNCAILNSVRGLHDKNSASQPCFTSDVMYNKYKSLVYTPPDLLARFCKANLSNAKKIGLICFPGLIYCDQEPLWLLNVIEDDCCFLDMLLSELICGIQAYCLI